MKYNFLIFCCECDLTSTVFTITDEDSLQLLFIADGQPHLDKTWINLISSELFVANIGSCAI